jgi:hypothetical protein
MQPTNTVNTTGDAINVYIIILLLIYTHIHTELERRAAQKGERLCEEAIETTLEEKT